MQTFLRDTKIKQIVSSLVKAHASGNVPPLPSLPFSNVLNFTTTRSQEAATHFSAPLTQERQVPRASSFPVARSGTQAALSRSSSATWPQARRRQELCPRPALRVPPGRGGAALPTACSPSGATPGACGLRSPALTLCRNSRATRRSMVHGGGRCASAGGARSGCAGEAAP